MKRMQTMSYLPWSSYGAGSRQSVVVSDMFFGRASRGRKASSEMS